MIAEILFHSLSSLAFSFFAPTLPLVFLPKSKQLSKQLSKQNDKQNQPSFILTPYWKAAFGKASFLLM